MSTSGTTGRPKGAMLTHLNLLMGVITAIRTSRLFDQTNVGLINVPLFQIASIGNLTPPMLLGTRSVIMPTAPFDVQTTLDVIEAEAVTSLFLVPAQWQVLCAHPDVTRRTRSLRTISSGAAPATVPLLETMAKTFPGSRSSRCSARPNVAGADSAAPPTLEDLTGWTTGRLASYKKPTGLVVLAELPRNASGKVLKHELRARYGGS
jgi:acyl-CoA synthetase (AMP-forming)/AMP-acid ligase II